VNSANEDSTMISGYMYFLTAVNHLVSIKVQLNGVKKSSSCTSTGGFQSTLSISVVDSLLVVALIMAR